MDQLAMLELHLFIIAVELLTILIVAIRLERHKAIIIAAIEKGKELDSQNKSSKETEIL